MPEQRLIDANKLKQHYSWWGDTEERKIFDDIVDVQPTVEPRAGHWIDGATLAPNMYDTEYFSACSECGARVTFKSVEKRDKRRPKFCHECGCKMDAQEGENNG